MNNLKLALTIVRYWRYRILICVDCHYPGTNWTDAWSHEVDHGHQVIRINAEVT